MNILLLQLRRIGDVVLTTPVLRALRKAFPAAQIDLVISRNAAALAPALGDAGEILMAEQPGSLLKVARRRYDWCIDFTHNDRSAFYTFLSRAPRRIAANNRKLRTLLRARAYTDLVDVDVRQVHTIDAHAALLRPLGLTNALPQPSLQLPASAVQSMLQLQHGHGIRKPFSIIHPGSARPEKFWVAERWAEVAQFLDSKGLRCVMTGSSAPLEQQHLRAIKDLAGRNVVDVSGQADLLTLAALVGEARIVVSVDSAPLHLAAASGTPVVGLFGPTNPFHWRPLHRASGIVVGDARSPLTEFSASAPRPAMNRISTGAVFNAIDAVLAVSPQ